MSAGAVAARLARREVVRRPWRSLVVLLLVVLPVTALTGLGVTLRSADRSWEDDFASRWGTADAVAYVGEEELPVRRQLLGVELPAGTRTLAVRTSWARLRSVDGRRSPAEITDLAVGDPLGAGLVTRLTGRPPSGPGEVLLSTRSARDLGVEVGDLLVLERPALTARVVGTAEWRSMISRPVMVVAADPATVAGPSGGSSVNVLVDLPAGAVADQALLDRLAAQGAELRAVDPRWGTTDTQAAIIWTWVGAAVAFVILGVVIAAAFAVTARRQLRLLGQLMANGAERRTLLATLVLQGTVVGLAGAGLGVLAAVAILVLGQGMLEELILDRRIDGIAVRPGDVVPVVVLATLASTVAAAIPARSAVRASVLQALAGRRPVGPYPARLVARGAAAVVVGLGLLAVVSAAARLAGRSLDLLGGSTTWLLSLTAIAGAVAVLLGTCAMAPALVARLEPLAGRLRGTARLAARSVARQRTRTGAVVAAVAVAAAGAVAGSTVWLTLDQGSVAGPSLPADVVLIDVNRSVVPADPDGEWFTERAPAPPGVVERVLEVLPGATVVPTRETRARDDVDPYAYSHFVVADEAYARVMGLSSQAREALERTGIAMWGLRPDGESPAGVTPGESTLQVIDGRGRSIEVPVEVVEDAAVGHGPLITPEAAARLGLETVPSITLVRAPQPLTRGQQEELSDLSADLASGVPDEDGQLAQTVWLEYSWEAWEPSTGQVTGVLVGLATLLALGVVALGLALSAAETRDERDVLAAVGAPPRALRRLAGAKAGVLSGMGAVIGVPLGFIPVLVVARAATFERATALDVVFPWVQVGLLVLVVPVAAVLATVAASSVALRLRPVRVSSMAFD